jgi:glycosyltransferase involved in cell wall biosynthesis
VSRLTLAPDLLSEEVVGVNAPRISVVIPVYNGRRYIAEAIESALGQSVQPLQVIVIDDGSTDGSADVVASYEPRVTCIRQPNRGPAAARNLGVERATGELLAFLDADDVWTPCKLAWQAQVLANDQACEAVLGRVENFISPELDESEHRALRKSASQKGAFLAGALLIRRDAFLRVGYLDARWRQGEFIEWWARAVRHRLRYAVLPELVLRRRLHDDNLTRREAAQGRSDYLRLLCEKLAHSRGAIDHSTSVQSDAP